MIALDRHSGYAVPNRMIFFGRWIKHLTVSISSGRVVKIDTFLLLKLGMGNGKTRPSGDSTDRHSYEHLNFSKGLSD